VAWDRDAPWSDAVAEALSPYDRNPLLARLEANRALHLASMYAQAVQTSALSEKNARKDAFLRKLLQSKTFALAERLSRLRQGGEPAFSKAEVRHLLDE
jgi:hypothetical protein